MASTDLPVTRVRPRGMNKDVNDLLGSLSIRPTPNILVQNKQPNYTSKPGNTFLSKSAEESIPENVQRSDFMHSSNSGGSAVNFGTGLHERFQPGPAEPRKLFQEPVSFNANEQYSTLGAVGSLASEKIHSLHMPEPLASEEIHSLHAPESQTAAAVDQSCLLNLDFQSNSAANTVVPVQDNDIDPDSQEKSSIPSPVFGKVQDTSSSKSDTDGSARVSSDDSVQSSSEDQLLLDDVGVKTRSSVALESTYSRINKKGFLFGHPETLEKYLIAILEQPWGFGIYCWNQLRPVPVDGVLQYREGKDKEFTVEFRLQGTKEYGVFLCRDNQTKSQFILKKISKENKRLIGIEFLTVHDQRFLPKIYGIYKEQNVLHIYQEYIAGGSLQACNWNFKEIRQFTEALLKSFKYLHQHNLVHGDVKLLNLMMRDPRDPSSVVVIDFESAKHPDYHYHGGGHTVTYLPPWHEQISSLKKYDPLLKTADLWAIACVIIFFLSPSDRSDMEEDRSGVWSQALENIRKYCENCDSVSMKRRKTVCQNCKVKLLQYIKDNGSNILQLHLGHLMNNASFDDPDWKVLKRVLEYLTSTKNYSRKKIEDAVGLIEETVSNPLPSNYDIDIHHPHL